MPHSNSHHIVPPQVFRWPHYTVLCHVLKLYCSTAGCLLATSRCSAPPINSHHTVLPQVVHQLHHAIWSMFSLFCHRLFASYITLSGACFHYSTTGCSPATSRYLEHVFTILPQVVRQLHHAALGHVFTDAIQFYHRLFASYITLFWAMF